jgi:ABC-type phosphate transport system substrate-binding protein
LGLLSVIASSAAAESVVLRLKGSDIEMAGQLRGFDGSKYTVEVGTGGIMSLDAALYECIGTPCLALAKPHIAPTGTSTFVIESASAARKPIAIEGSPAIGLDLIPALIRAYAADMGGTVKQLVGTNSREARFRVTDARGAEFANLDLKRYGSEAAFQSLRNGSAVIGVSSRPISVEETQALISAQPQVKSSNYEHVLGLDGLVVIVPPG